MAYEKPKSVPDPELMKHKAKTTPGVHLIKYESGCINAVARALSGGYLGIVTSAIIITREIANTEAVDSMKKEGLNIDINMVNKEEPAYQSYTLYSFWPTVGKKS